MLRPESDLPPEVDTSRPHTARMYDYFLGGKDNISQEVRADFRNRGRTLVIAGQTLLFEKRLIARSRTFMHYYVPWCPFLRGACPDFCLTPLTGALLAGLGFCRWFLAGRVRAGFPGGGPWRACGARRARGGRRLAGRAAGGGRF
ncbi:MAG: SAM-dependent methyltransferase [Trebonia sp.]